MGIHFNAEHRVFHLQGPNTSYVIQLNKNGVPMHAYWGRKVSDAPWEGMLDFQERASFSPNPFPEDRTVSFDTLPQEYPAYGTSDFRHPAYQIQLEDGSTITELAYVEHRIVNGKPKLKGLPSTYAEKEEEAQTLELVLQDEKTGLRVLLAYSVFAEHDAIVRSVKLSNKGESALRLLRVLSGSVDFRHDRFHFLQLSGAWARERDVYRRQVVPGIQSVESRRGSSSHQQNPFVALVSPNANENHGEAYGFSLVYSGSFVAQAEVDQFRTTRVSVGINPFDFEWLLEAGEEFQTPELVMVYSCEGLGEMSRTYHRLYRSRLCRGAHRDRTRPVLVNNWEATYFQFNADKIENIAKVGQELGIELFVLDDGWFGHRDNDDSSLGDWKVDYRKLPGGLADLASRVNRLDMQFGLWFEPEMVSPDSDLYRTHPDWCLHVEGRRRTEARQQLILDLSRDDVCDYLIESVSSVLRSAPITYVKWDMNRNMTEIGSALLPPQRQRETAHRYMLGLYRVLETITSEFPDVLFESCSGGGGRFDPGMLYYMPQTWTSDNTDAVSRLRIQYGTSMVYPVSAMGAHVSAVPNHQVNRMTSLKTRGDVAMSGNFGYELDLTQMSDEEKAIVKDQVRQYKDIRHLVQFGDFYRLRSPFEGNDTSWMMVAADRSEAFAVYIRVLAEPNAPLDWLKFKGLDASARYRADGSDAIYGGDQLMYAGLPIPRLHGDYQSHVWHFVRI
ncbi:alpha-galactosidase [Cohnella cholangitidis]|uniref:Alpha-galactosidase n=1 Tax=Cohnella cholangitidis TaxID=2598458 RepID=A0A7G5C4Q9_9BACL|nr:alpha-galactosidase [Cohnella cholangitidis]QMV44193.1 alpha-galactosidase [Cohnella cholangitidis]